MKSVRREIRFASRQVVTGVFVLLAALSLAPGAHAAVEAPVTATSAAALAPTLASAAYGPEALANLRVVYDSRADLRAVFGADGVAVPAMKAKGLPSLEEWAKRYGHKEHPSLLGAFGVTAAPPAAIATPAMPPALKERPAAYVPVKSTEATFAPKTFTAKSVLVIDDATRKVLLSRNANQSWPIASLSKLMTALVSLDRGVNMNSSFVINAGDDVGGAKLNVDGKTPLTVRQIFDVMLVGSANNAANAMARTTGLSKSEFVTAMNARAKAMGLTTTTFADPTGIELENVSTATEVAALAIEAFSQTPIKRATTTASVTLVTAKQTHTVKNTDWLLTDPNNGLYVLGGKTGYLNESGWNFVVRMRDARMRPVIVVIFGSSDRQQSFNDATAAAKWVWANYQWKAAKKS